MSRFFVLVGIAAALVFGSGRELRSASPQQIPMVLTGVWAGSADVVADWIEQPTVTVTLFISGEGRVRGTIGDATLRNGRFEQNRGPFFRFFSVKTDWIVIGELEGSIIRAEGLQRTQLTMPLNWVRDHFEGRFTAWDRTVRGRDNRGVSGRLRLDRLW